ncbi:uncharacterized protein [Zea mays]|uniref:uncharacterized protein isoform X4 n=1 Tax=Zea mays TaxID=4577 RepID=UPI000C6C5614|nr:uncharacterized protein LOC111589336 isoform X4 [Zea mays]|eukprot:XP_023155944.1 uncharacterized protein LOC111589336 isoform X2 [Zea mays]
MATSSLSLPPWSKSGSGKAMRSFSEKDILSLIAKLVLRGVEQIFVGGVAWETTEVFRAQGALEIYMSQQLNDCTS